MTRHTLVLNEEVLQRAMRALGQPTIRATVDFALRRAVELTEAELAERASQRREYFEKLPEHADLEVLASDEMWP